MEYLKKLNKEISKRENSFSNAIASDKSSSKEVKDFQRQILSILTSSQVENVSNPDLIRENSFTETLNKDAKMAFKQGCDDPNQFKGVAQGACPQSPEDLITHLQKKFQVSTLG